MWPPVIGHIDTINFIVSKELWLKYRTAYNRPSAGDYYFIHTVYQTNPVVKFLGGQPVAKTIRVSQGAPEEWDFAIRN